MKNRQISQLIKERHQWKSGRILVLTGARQTGKTTLVRKLFPGYRYITLEDPVIRSQYSRMTAEQWKDLFPEALLDEVQKQPELIESIKAVYDQWPDPKYILLGSSQLLLLEKVKESLAGRCIILELYPLTLPELGTASWDEAVDHSLFQLEMEPGTTAPYLPSFHLDQKMLAKQKAWDHYLAYGSYPAVSDPEMIPEEKFSWLRDYVSTYLERDIRDLASFRDLEPFVRLQKYLAQNTACLVNASAIARNLGITAKTVSRYIQYFEISYQVVVLPAWSQNVTRRLIKMPKLHFLDNGIIQAVLQKTGGITGNEFESMVVAEIYKQISTANKQVQLYHLRTHDGKEVDLLIEFPDHYLAFEIKMTQHVTRADGRNFAGLEEILDKPLRRAFILSNDPETKWFGEKVVALLVAYFLG